MPSTPNQMSFEARPNTPSVKKLFRLSEQVSDRLKDGQRRFRRKIFPIRAASVRENPKEEPSPTGPFTHIILVSLSYPGLLDRLGPGTSRLMGPKYDFCLLLEHFEYGEVGNLIEFSLINDFSAFVKNSAGNPNLISKTDTSKTAIRDKVQSVMKNIPPGSNVLFYFEGHATGEGIIAGDGKQISGSELRSWLNSSSNCSCSVTAVLDTCHSGGFLDLPYNYEVNSKGAVEVEKVRRERESISMIEISAARREQLAYSARLGEGFHGQLTWSFVQFLKTATNLTVESLVSYLYRHCDPSGAQLPQVSVTHDFRDGPRSTGIRTFGTGSRVLRECSRVLGMERGSPFARAESERTRSSLIGRKSSFEALRPLSEPGRAPPKLLMWLHVEGF